MGGLLSVRKRFHMSLGGWEDELQCECADGGIPMSASRTGQRLLQCHQWNADNKVEEISPSKLEWRTEARVPSLGGKTLSALGYFTEGGSTGPISCGRNRANLVVAVDRLYDSKKINY